MLKADTITKLKSTLVGFDIDKMIAAATHAEEQDFEFPEVTVLTAAELNTRDTNKVAEGKTAGFTEGKTAGLEIASKQIAKKFNLPDTVNTKKLEEVVEAVNATVATGDTGLKEQITLLQKKTETLTTEKESLVKEKEALAFDTQIISMFPSNRDSSLTDAERLALVKMNYEFEKSTDGKMTVKKDGTVIRVESTQDPLPVKDAIGKLFTEKKWVSEEITGGRGGGNNSAGGSGGAITKASDARAEWKKKNPEGSETSAECTNFVVEAANKAGDSFVFD